MRKQSNDGRSRGGRNRSGGAGSSQGREARTPPGGGGPVAAPLRRDDGPAVVLRAGREKSLQNRHPWVFSGAIASAGSSLSDGDVVEVRGADGQFLARGTLNMRSQIVVRVLTWHEAETIDDTFFERRVERAVRARGDAKVTRLVHAESDGLPGLVVDRYGDFCVLSASTLGMDRHKAAIVRALEATVHPRGIWERSDVDGRDKEGLPPSTGLLSGAPPPELLEVEEATHGGGNVTLLVDVRKGHKTGTYLDQADNRRLVAARARDADVLNLFSYTGGFGLHAARAGARHVTNVDSSADALALSARAAERNGVGSVMEHLRADVFEAVRRFRDEGKTFDLIIVDPPKLVHSAAEVDRGARAYKDLSRLAFALTRPGGFVATFSCSGLVAAHLFQQIVWSASREANRDVQILARLGQPSDHPIALCFPEGEYLKGLLCRVG